MKKQYITPDLQITEMKTMGMLAVSKTVTEEYPTEYGVPEFQFDE